MNRPGRFPFFSSLSSSSIIRSGLAVVRIWQNLADKLRRGEGWHQLISGSHQKGHPAFRQPESIKAEPARQEEKQGLMRSLGPLLYDLLRPDKDKRYQAVAKLHSDLTNTAPFAGDNQ